MAGVTLFAPSTSTPGQIMTGEMARRRIGRDAAGVPLPGRIDERRRFHIRFRAEEADVDELEHVNNAAWVGWIQDASVAHWLAAAPPEEADRYVAMVVRHEVDYRRNISDGTVVVATTWIEEAPRGASYKRRVDFTDDEGTLLVAAISRWVLIDRESGRLARVPKHLFALFVQKEAGCGHDETAGSACAR